MVTLAGCLLLAVALFAQPQAQKRSEEQRKKVFERIQSEKIAFLTNALDLNPEEAQKFWPVYNECAKKIGEAQAARMKAFAELRAKKAQPVSEKEMEKKVEAYVEASKEAAQVMYDYYPKFKKVLPIEKVAKLYQAEDSFQQRMIRNLREQPHDSARTRQQNAEKKADKSTKPTKPSKQERPQVEPNPGKSAEILQ